jgi:hypothetical protein
VLDTLTVIMYFELDRTSNVQHICRNKRWWLVESRRMRWAGHAARMEEVRAAYNILVGRPEGRRPLGRPRQRWEDNIRMDLREIEFGDVDWIHLAQDRERWQAFVNTVMNLRVP